jgi:hypothetical protein
MLDGRVNLRVFSGFAQVFGPDGCPETQMPVLMAVTRGLRPRSPHARARNARQDARPPSEGMPTMTFTRVFALAIPLALISAANASAGVVPIGVIGDSVADEYAFYPSQQAARNFVEILASRGDAQNGFSFGTLTTDSRGEPRNQGYEFNWARSGARTDDIRPQVEGLARQVAAGQVNYGMAFIGTNNFRDVLLNGADPIETSRGAIGNTVAAASTLLAASPDFKLALANVPDITLLPEARAALKADPSLSPQFEQVRTLIDSYNDNLAFQFANNPRVALVDANALLDTLAQGPTIGGITLDPINSGPELSNLFVDPIHPGTVAQSLLADAYVSALGLTPAPTPEPEPTPNPTPIPLPAAVWAALAGAPFVLAGVRRMRRTR